MLDTLVLRVHKEIVDFLGHILREILPITLIILEILLEWITFSADE
jgi:hypothetical protein